MKPQPRPALKRAEDADLHPALSVAPTQVPTQLTRDVAAEEPDVPAPKKRKKSKQGKKRFQSAGQATSDVLRGANRASDKAVKMSVRVPKNVQKEIKAVAKHSGSSVDAIVTQALAEWLGDPRRW